MPPYVRLPGSWYNEHPGSVTGAGQKRRGRQFAPAPLCVSPGTVGQELAPGDTIVDSLVLHRLELCLNLDDVRGSRVDEDLVDRPLAAGRGRDPLTCRFGRHPNVGMRVIGHLLHR